MTVRRLGLGDGERLRALRLRALSDAPYAFGSSHAREAAHPPQYWYALAAESEVGERAVVFVAIERSGVTVDRAAGETRWLGMAGGHIRADYPSVATVWGMWVDPDARRRGFGRCLLDAVKEWAAERGAGRLELSVTDRAPAAATLYRRLGFAETGEARPLASDPSIAEFLMTQALTD